MTRLDLTPEETFAVSRVVGHALDQAHDDQTRAYLQDLIDDEYENATEDREQELEGLLGGVLDRLVPDKTPEREALLALVRYLGEQETKPLLPIDLHAQLREALGDDFYRPVEEAS